ncbi:MAG: hypothetical protein KGZ83_03000 [Sulfuricella sp.]|nr:hypothetical protein [Sulfuricella sp.]
MFIHYHEQRIGFGNVALKTRSRELVRFVGYLAWRYRQRGGPEWVGIEEMRGVTGSAEPKQYQRYLDTLAKKGLPVVEFRHKTKGPWRLSEKVKNVSFDLTGDELARCFPAAEDEIAEPGHHTDGNDGLYDFVRLCAEADTSFHDGNLATDDDHSTLAILAGNQFFAPPPDIEILLHLKIARAAMRASRHVEAAKSIKHAEAVANRHPVRHGELAVRIKLAKSKLLFDQGKTAQSAALLDSIPIHECRDMHALAQYHNLQGLLTKRLLRLAIEEGKKQLENSAPKSFEQSADHFRRAIAMHLFINDYDGVQAACFNLGDLCGFAYRNIAGLHNESLLDQALHWLALSEVICNKVGVGGDSIWALLTMFDIAVSTGLSLDYLKSKTSGIFNRFANYDAIADDIWTEAQRIGNSQEMAECRELMYRLTMQRGDTAQAREHALAALDLFHDLKRTDMIRSLKKMIAQLEEKNGKGKKTGT